jgi:glucose/arabinose dehydrogenase
MNRQWLSIALAAAVATAACSNTSGFDQVQGYGPTPTLPEPDTSLIPTIEVVTAVGWAEGQQPTPAPGTLVTAFAKGLDHPRWLHVLPNGDVLVAETNAPVRPDAGKGVKGWFFKRYQKKAGGAVPSANRITLLRDADGDGTAELSVPFMTGLNSPFGMALVGQTLFIANSDAVVKVNYRESATEISEAPQKVADLPGGTLNHHWTKGLIASADGAKLYASVGSNSNVGEAGIEKEEGRAAIWEIDIATGASRIYATGLRNPVGMAWEPATNTLWAAVNERDELGNDLVPDYMTSVRDGGFYGWPYSYYGQHVDERVKPARGQGDCARLRAGLAHRVAGPRLLDVEPAARGDAGRHVRGPTRLVEPRAARRLPGDLRAVQRRQTRGHADRSADRFCSRRRGDGAPGRRGARCTWRPAGGRRCW